MTDATIFAGIRMETANAIATQIDGTRSVSAIEIEGRGKDFSSAQANLIAGQIAAGKGDAQALMGIGLPTALASAIVDAIDAKKAAATT